MRKRVLFVGGKMHGTVREVDDARCKPREYVQVPIVINRETPWSWSEADTTAAESGMGMAGLRTQIYYYVVLHNAGHHGMDRPLGVFACNSEASPALVLDAFVDYAQRELAL